MLKRLGASLLGLLLPPRCQACQADLHLSNMMGICASCEARIRWIASPHCQTCGRTLTYTTEGRCELCRSSGETFHFDRAYACAAYEGPLRDILRRYKFGRKKALERFIGSRLVDFATQHFKHSDFDAVMAVPLDPARQFARGFNQSLQLSRMISSAMKLKDISSLAARKKSASCQSLLPKRERKINIQNMFYLRNSDAFKKFKSILLVDDILTSGQTLSECARVLKEAGAYCVTVLAFARDRKSTRLNSSH